MLKIKDFVGRCKCLSRVTVKNDFLVTGAKVYHDRDGYFLTIDRNEKKYRPSYNVVDVCKTESPLILLEVDYSIKYLSIT